MEWDHKILLVIGVLIGVFIGVFVMCLMVMARDTDKAIERIKRGGKDDPH